MYKDPEYTSGKEVCIVYAHFLSCVWVLALSLFRGHCLSRMCAPKFSDMHSCLLNHQICNHFPCTQSGLIATPEVETFELSDGDQFLILACDGENTWSVSYLCPHNYCSSQYACLLSCTRIPLLGLWDVMTAEDACELVYDKVSFWQHQHSCG